MIRVNLGLTSEDLKREINSDEYTHEESRRVVINELNEIIKKDNFISYDSINQEEIILISDIEKEIIDCCNPLNRSIYNSLKDNDDLPMHLKGEKIGDILMGEQKEYVSKKYFNINDSNVDSKMHVLPALRWYAKAALDGNIEALSKIYSIILIDRLDYQVHTKIQKAFLFELAYDGDFDKMYEIYEQYNNYGSQRKDILNYLVLPNKIKAEKWLNIIKNNRPTKISVNGLKYYLFDKSEIAENYYQEAIKKDCVDYYYWIVSRYKPNSEIGAEHCLKAFNAGNYHYIRYVLEYYLRIGDINKFKEYANKGFELNVELDIVNCISDNQKLLSKISTVEYEIDLLNRIISKNPSYKEAIKNNIKRCYKKSLFGKYSRLI